MRTLHRHLQHLLNPLHLYCRLVQVGLTEPVARRLCLAYERTVYRHLLA